MAASVFAIWYGMSGFVNHGATIGLVYSAIGTIILVVLAVAFVRVGKKDTKNKTKS